MYPNVVLFHGRLHIFTSGVLYGHTFLHIAGAVLHFSVHRVIQHLTPLCIFQVLYILHRVLHVYVQMVSHMNYTLDVIWSI